MVAIARCVACHRRIADEVTWRGYGPTCARKAGVIPVGGTKERARNRPWSADDEARKRRREARRRLVTRMRAERWGLVKRAKASDERQLQFCFECCAALDGTGETE